MGTSAVTATPNVKRQLSPPAAAPTQSKIEIAAVDPIIEYGARDSNSLKITKQLFKFLSALPSHSPSISDGELQFSIANLNQKVQGQRFAFPLYSTTIDAQTIHHQIVLDSATDRCISYVPSTKIFSSAPCNTIQTKFMTYRTMISPISAPKPIATARSTTYFVQAQFLLQQGESSEQLSCLGFNSLTKKLTTTWCNSTMSNWYAYTV